MFRSLKSFVLLAMVVLMVSGSALFSAAHTSTAASQAGIGSDGRTYPPGGTRVGNKVFYANGAVVLEFAPTEESGAFFGPRCPNGWFCLFEHKDWGGRMLQFSDCCYMQFLSNYGFTNQASSWHSRINTDVHVGYEGGDLFCADSQARSSYVGSANNDKADNIFISSFDIIC